MKIGTITFHWVTNYGAVLQAYALQKVLLNNGFESEVINYVPYAVKYRQILSDLKRHNINNLIKEIKINRFRKKYIKYSSKKYYKNSQLNKANQKYDTFVCGSDQIWNEWFILHSEPNINLSYYLNFANLDKKKISYATSFGTDKLSEKIIRIIEPELRKFHSINVRENSGKVIINDMGLNSNIVADPTLLLDRIHYEELFSAKKIFKKYDCFPYILHKNQKIALNVYNYIHKQYFKNEYPQYTENPISICEWLFYIKNSKFVVTNSFHGTIFAILFHTPFIVTAVEGSRMNDRIITLLNTLGLGERLLEYFDTKHIDSLMNDSIVWTEVDKKLNDTREFSIKILLEALRANSL
jgi:hypothetical protein